MAPPFVVNSVTYELVISPPPGGIPGPTDWVGVVAIIDTDKDTAKTIDELLPPTDDCGLPGAFALPWYGPYMEEIVGLGKSAGAGERVCYNAESLLVKNAARSFIAPIDESKVFLYIEYMNPGF